MEFLQQIEQSSFPLWVRESGSLLGFPTFLFVHTLGLAVVSGLCAGIDLRVLGFAPRVPLPAFRPLFSLIWWAFLVTAVSGATLLSTEASAKLTSPVFYIKMLLIAAALTILQRLRRRVFDAPDADAAAVTAGVRGLAFGSLCLWIATTVAGRLMAYL